MPTDLRVVTDGHRTNGSTPADDHDQQERPARRPLPLRLAHGAAAGAVATVVMSVGMGAAREVGVLGTPPPLRIVEGALRASGRRRPRRWGGPGPVATVGLAGLAHLGFGAGSGALFAAARPPSRGRDVAVGVLFGLGLWASTYVGVLPAARLMPPVERDRAGRPEAMVAAHVLYGATLGLIDGRLARRTGG